jgi:hypothetical protein
LEDRERSAEAEQREGNAAGSADAGVAKVESTAGSFDPNDGHLFGVTSGR